MNEHYSPEEEENEKKRWSQDRERAEAGLSEQALSEVSGEINALSIEVFANPSTEQSRVDLADIGRVGVIDIKSTETLDAINEVFGGQKDETGFAPPTLSQTPIEGTDKDRYTLKLVHKGDGFLEGVQVVEFVYDEAGQEVYKRTAADEVDPMLMLRKNHTETRLAALNDRMGRTRLGVEILLTDRELPDSVREKMQAAEDAEDAIGGIREKLDAEFAKATQVTDEGKVKGADVESSMSLMVQKIAGERALKDAQLNLMGAVAEFGESENDEGLASLAAAYLALDLDIKELEAEHARVVRDVGNSDLAEAHFQQEIATENNGIAAELVRLASALRSQALQE